MTTPELVMWAVVIVLGLGGGLRNPTSLALAASWLVGQVYYLATGDGLALGEYFMADIAVLTVILAKATWREGCRTYPTLRLQIQCCWRAISMWDKLIAGGYIFAAWPVYVSTLSPYAHYWALYYIVVAQFLLAAGEAIQSLLGDRKEKALNRPPGGSGLMFVRAGGSG